MNEVLIIMMIIGLILYPRKDTFIDRFRLRMGFIEVELSTKEKNGPSSQDNRSNRT